VLSVGLGCDQATKQIARVHLEHAAPISLFYGIVELRYVENPGAFLSLGASLPEGVRRVFFQLGVPAALLALCIGMLRGALLSRRGGVGLALVMSGGFGNWLDRLFHDGAVTDFLRLGIGPIHTGIFNVADVAILAGAALLVFGMGPSGDPVPEPAEDG
jgi:signal peptidase II